MHLYYRCTNIANRVSSAQHEFVWDGTPPTMRVAARDSAVHRYVKDGDPAPLQLRESPCTEYRSVVLVCFSSPISLIGTLPGSDEGDVLLSNSLSLINFRPRAGLVHKCVMINSGHLQMKISFEEGDVDSMTSRVSFAVYHAPDDSSNMIAATPDHELKPILFQGEKILRRRGLGGRR